MAIYSPRSARTVVVLGSAPGTEEAVKAAGVTAGSAQAAASDIDTAPNTALVVTAFIALAAVYAVAAFFISPRVDATPLDDFNPSEGIGAFALFYVFAQAVERILEPVSRVLLATTTQTRERDNAVVEAKNDPDSAQKAKEAADKQAVVDRKRSNRAVVFWGVATALGFLASATMEAYFLRAVGDTDAERWAEILVTGAIIGAGTKPLHDLITRIEKKKEQAQDPPETAPAG